MGEAQPQIRSHIGGRFFLVFACNPFSGDCVVSEIRMILGRLTVHVQKNWLKGLFFLWPASVVAQTDLTALDHDMVGPRAQVLVLGTVHLSGLPDGFAPAALQGVLDRLAAFRPEIITIEAESGEECDLALRHAEKYGADYCEAPTAAQNATGLNIPAALAEIERTLKHWPPEPGPAQRRRLASLFLAANDSASAYVQWLQLPHAERRTGDGLDAALVAHMAKIDRSRNENYQIAARLAAQLKLQRVFPVDNHTGDRMQVPDIKTFVRDLEAAWKEGGDALALRKVREDELSRATDLLPLYRYINLPEGLRVLAEANVRPALRSTSAQRYPQMWVAGWETRNLRMVANIRETFREHPDARVLSIVGVSHKPWFDAWLGQLQGVDVVDVQRVLE